MKTIYLSLLFSSFFVFTNCNNPTSENSIENNSAQINKEYYQLKVYSFDNDEQIKVVDKYLKEAFLPGIKRIGIKNIGVFKLRQNNTDSIQKTFVLIPFKSIDQFLNLENNLIQDKDYKIAGKDYFTAFYNQPPYHRIETTLMTAFSSVPIMKSPQWSNPRSERVYELRSYESPTEEYYKNKVEMFNTGGEIKLFEHININTVFFGEVISGSKMPNFMYMTTFSDQKSRDKKWVEFKSSAEWKEMKEIPKYKNTVSHVDKIFLFPTEYSDY